MYFDFINIWNKQRISLATEELLKNITKSVYDDLTHPPSGVANVSQWSKKPGCWQSIQKMLIDIPIEFINELLEKEELSEDKRSAKKQQKQDNGIEAQKKVFELANKNKWIQIKTFGMDNNELSLKDNSLLDIAISIPNKIPSEKQSQEIMNILYRLELIGFEISI
jgi:nitrogenase molybdenum-iron protein alpha/beta subunit